MSSKAVLLTLVCQVVSLDTRLLDPRRPSADPNKHEKLEGLMKYDPLLPFIPTQVASYFQTVAGVNMAYTTPTRLESQCLMLALGGSDVFFTRLSPSRSFDLLPTTFSRTALLFAIGGLVGLWFAAKRYGDNNIKKIAWA